MHTVKHTHQTSDIFTPYYRLVPGELIQVIESIGVQSGRRIPVDFVRL